MCLAGSVVGSVDKRGSVSTSQSSGREVQGVLAFPEAPLLAPCTRAKLRLSATDVLGQVSSGLFCHDVSGIPGGPVLVMQPPRQLFPEAMPIALFELAVGGLRTTKRSREIRHGRKRGLSGVDPAWEPRCDLLH